MLSPLDESRAQERAERLLLRFGSLALVLAASAEAQASALNEDGQVISLLRATREVTVHAYRGRLSAGPLFPGNAAVVDYLEVAMGHRQSEEVRVLFLNASNELILDEVVSMGTVDRSEIHPREIIRRAIEIGAVSLILAHNHPSGNTQPSRSDIAATRRLAAAAEVMGMQLLDHLITGTRGTFSLREGGWFKNLPRFAE